MRETQFQFHYFLEVKTSGEGNDIVPNSERVVVCAKIEVMDPLLDIKSTKSVDMEVRTRLDHPSSPGNPTATTIGTTSPSSGSSNNGKKISTIRQSFTADTPYFDAYVDRELCHLTILTETLYDISARARAAGQCGETMADATRKLSMACKLYPTFDRNGEDWVRAADGDEEGKLREKKICDARKVAVGKEMGGVLRILGEVSSSSWVLGWFAYGTGCKCLVRNPFQCPFYPLPFPKGSRRNC